MNQNEKFIALKPVYKSFLFDSKEAWHKTLTDPRYTYDMNFYDFMSLYMKYRNKYKV